MGKPRLGRLERQIVREYHSRRLAHKAEVIARNLSEPKPENSGNYATIFSKLGSFGARAKVGQRQLFSTPKGRTR